MSIQHWRFGDLGTGCRLLRTVGLAIAVAAIVLGIGGQAPMGVAQGIAEKERPSSGTRHALIVCGLPGDAEHEGMFAAVLQGLCDGLTERCQFPADQVLVWSGSERQSKKAPVNCSYQGPGTRESIEAGARQLRAGVRREDALWVIVVGHAHFDGRRAWLNLPGPDIDAEEFGRYFQGITCGEQVFFLTTPASGYAIKFLSQKERVVITATEADREVNETIFPTILAEILSTPPPFSELDPDKDGRVTLFDLYLSVCRRVLQTYADAKNIPTEHAQLDDNGDGHGTEIQLDYVEAELGGRSNGETRPTTHPGADGAVTATIDLTPFFTDPTVGPETDTEKTPPQLPAQGRDAR